MITDGSSSTGRRRPMSRDEAGLRAVANVSRVKGAVGVSALQEAQAQTVNSRRLESSESLRSRVQKIYDKKVAQRQKLANVVPRNPEGDLTQPANRRSSKSSRPKHFWE